MRATIASVAEQAGVSPTTASLVLNGGKSSIPISEATRQRVRAVAKQMGYRPNRIARALASGRTNTVSLWIPSLANPLYSQIVCLLESESAKRGYQLVVNQVPNDAEQIKEWARLPRWPSDGAILINVHWYAAMVSHHVIETIPVVCVGAYLSEEVDYVGIDLASGTREAMRHLLSTGCRRAAMVGPGPGEEASERATVFHQSVADAGLEPEFICAFPEFREYAHSAFLDYVKARGCPDAVFCYNDDIAIGVHRAVRDLGLDMPSDVALVGCDGISLTEFVDPRISTIVAPFEQACAMGWDFLENRIRDASLPLQRATLSSRLVIRGSSDRLGCRTSITCPGIGAGVGRRGGGSDDPR